MENKTIYPKASLADYGYRETPAYVKKITKILKAALTYFIVFLLYVSVIVIFIESLNSSHDMRSFDQVTLKWYTNIFTQVQDTEQIKAMLIVVKNTFVVSIIATLVATVLGTFFAIGLYSFQKKKRQQWMLMNNIPLLNADIVTGISLMLLFSLLRPLFPSIFGLFTLVIAHLFFTFPYVILSVMPKLKETDPNLMDAALDLGVKPFKSIVKVLIPAVQSGVFAGMLLAFTMSIDDFVISYFNKGGYNNLSIWLYGVLGKTDATPSVYALSTLMTLFTLVALVVFQSINNHNNKKGKLWLRK